MPVQKHALLSVLPWALLSYTERHNAMAFNTMATGTGGEATGEDATVAVISDPSELIARY